MNWDKYIYPVDIKYNKELLYDTVSNIKVWPFYSPDNGKTVLQHKDILFPVDAEALRIKTLIRESTSYSFSLVPPKQSTGMHTDKNRGCTLIIPIDPNPHLIEFEIDNEIVKYFYEGPVLTNAKTMHNGVNHTDQNRYNLLFHFEKSYEEIVQKAKDDILVLKWIQMYPIQSYIDNEYIENYFSITNNAENIIKYFENGISVNNKLIYYKKASDYEICQAIKILLETNITRIDLK